MGKPLRIKFAGKEAEVVRAVKDYGIDTARAMYGAKNRSCFMAWLKDNTGEQWKSNPLERMKGGDKQKWIGEHRDTILDCLEIFGEDWVKANFCMPYGTLERVVGSSHHPFLGYDKKLTRLERLELDVRGLLKCVKEIEQRQSLQETRIDIAEQGTREVRLAQRERDEQYSKFVQLVSGQLSQKVQGLLEGFLSCAINPGETMRLPRPDDLSVNSLIAQGEKLVEEG